MNPLKVKASATPINSANFSGLQPMSDAEVKNYIANIITEKFAADTDGTGTAELNVDTANLLSGTSIGNFVDTVRTESIGDHPATGATTSTTYYAKQVTSVASESITNRPIKWEDNAAELSDSDIDGVMDLVIESMVSEDSYTAGQYKLQATAPSGGTWVARYTITDEAQGGNTTTYLWQKTVATSSGDSDLTPLKSNNANSLKQMSVAEIEQLVPNFRNRIIDTSIGTYKFQSTTPSGGTWVQAGDTLSDTRQSIAELTYGSGAGYSGAYSNTFTNVYTNQYTKTYSQDFVATYGAGTSTADYTGAYNRQYTRAWSGNYDGPSYTSGPTTVSYTGAYGGATYLGYYSGPSGLSYSGPSYTSGPTTVSYTGAYGGATYTGVYNPESNYTSGPTTVSYTGQYTDEFVTISEAYAPGVPPFEVDPYVAPVQYTGAYNRQYTGPAYTGPGVLSYAGPPNYTSGPTTVSYTGQYTDEFVITSIGYASGLPPVPYVSAVQYTGAYSRQYTGPAYATSYSTIINYTSTSFVPYTGAYSRQYTGPGYVGIYSGTVNFTSSSFVPYTGNYSRVYTGPAYAATYGGTYSTNYTKQYTGTYSRAYGGGTFSGAYTGDYTAQYSGEYTNQYSGAFSGAYALGVTYSGDTIQATKDTVATTKLWIRTA